MKNILSLAIAMLVSFGCFAQLRAPSLSPSCTLVQKLGLTTVTIDYSRPSKKGRTVFGTDGLVEYNEYWRTGANAVTTIDISSAVTIQDQSIAKGKYAILSTLTDSTWTIHLFPYEQKSWNHFTKLDPTYSLTSNTEQIQTRETLGISLEKINLDRADLVFSWANTKTAFALNASAKDKMLKKIEAIVNGPSLNDYFQAAVYLHESKIDLPRALHYIQKVTSSEQARFFHVYRELLILRDLQKYDEIEQVGQRTIRLAEKANNKDVSRSASRIIRQMSESN